jgi:hypothetical protein
MEGDKEIKAMLQDTALEVFEERHPNLSKEFRKIQEEQYKLFASKLLDYGIGNIAMGGDLQNDNDIKYSLTGIQIRLHDKVSRLKNLLSSDRAFVVAESLADTFLDISNYGIIAKIISNRNWK